MSIFEPIQFPKPKAGICDLCGTYDSKLVNGACKSCRDKHNVKDYEQQPNEE